MNKNKARVFHFDLHGKREEKYDFLGNQDLEKAFIDEFNIECWIFQCRIFIPS